MKKLHFIENVNYLRLINNQIYYINSKTRELYSINVDRMPQRLVNRKVDNYVFQTNSIVFQSDNTIYRLEDDSDIEIIKSDETNYFGLQDYLFNNKAIISLTKKNDWLANSMLLISDRNEIEKFDFIFNAEIYFDNYYCNHNNESVFTYTNLHNEIWKVDVTNYGRDIAKNPETGEVLWDNLNGIKDDLFADNKNIYVPLKGGQLLALDGGTGEKVWMFDNEKYGIYNIFKNKIYKGDGKSIIVINAINGQAEKELHFKNIPVLKGYIPAGPFLIYDDIIISTDVLYGKICLLNRSTLEVEDFFSLNKKLVNSKSAIIWNDNKLYVLDIEQTLHIFEKDQNEIS